MNQKKDEDLWVWVVVQDPERSEQLLGQHDEESGISFIPVFHEKEEAEAVLPSLVRDDRLTYQPQAILYTELASHATANGFHLFMLDGGGRILEKIGP